MIKKLLFIFMMSLSYVGVQAQGIDFDGELPEGYDIVVEEFQVHDADLGLGMAELDGYTTYRLYVNCLNPTDRIATVTGISGCATCIEFSGDLYQITDPFGGITASLPCAFFNTFEDADAMGWGLNYYDSYVTIGSHCDGGFDPDNPDQPWTTVNTISGSTEPDPDWQVEFEAGNSFCIDDPVGGSWYSINSAEQAYNTWAGDDLQILLGQFTTNGTVSGILSFNILPEGNGGDDAYNICQAPFPSDLVFGCTDEAACNYDSLAVADDGNCVYECALEIGEVTITNLPTCPTSLDGDILVTSTGGQDGLTYTLVGYGSNSTGVFNNAVMGGEYTIQVTDESPLVCGEEETCLVEQTFTVDLEALDMEVTFTDPICYSTASGSVSFDGSGGTGPYTYDFDDSGSFSDVTEYGDLENGTYNIDMLDANGCPFATSVTLTDPDQLVIDMGIVTNSNCATNPDGSIELTISGGNPDYEVFLDGESQGNTLIVEGLGEGNYDIEVVDASGCTTSESYDISEPLPITIDFVGTSDAVWCEQLGAFILDSLGTITYENLMGGSGTLTLFWDNVPAGYVPTPSVNSEFLINCIPGEYSFVVTDATGCTLESGTITVGQINSQQEDCVISVEELSVDFNLSVFPNPSNGLFNLAVESYSGEKMIVEITDALGRVVSSEQLNAISGSSIHELNIGSEAAGFYNLQVTIGNVSKNVKLMKQH